VPPEEHFDANVTSAFDVGGLGTAIGRYHLVQRIGEGGMGEVWLAEQKEPVRRRVALKLVKAGMNTREVMARFESERQALALMEHPAIAKVFDAGSTPQGAPYFVMEYVAGVPITTYCDNHRLSTRDRLELFVHVCEGVQHAHQKAIIHRDLKPSNILVTEVDGHPVPKIIDFGVAKALSQRLTADTLYTRAGTLLGTPEYMSPEQALSSGEDIDTRSDVYSLGIIFYELLAGVPPIDLRKIAFDEFLRRLREEDPPKPSTKIRAQDVATSTETARKRQSEAPALAKQMRGDLDSIALKALEKERARRYGSPSDFAADIGRYLRNEAVLAVPLSLAYRARKFARRYRGALVTACAFALVLIVAAAVSIRQSIRANREAAVARAVNDFLQNDLLAQADAGRQAGPNTKPDPDLKVRTVLDRAAARIPGKFDKEPEVEASIRDTIGTTYYSLGVYPEAWKQLERALELRRKVLGPQHPDTLDSMESLANNYEKEGRYPEAEALFSQELEIFRRVRGPEHPETLAHMSRLANTYLYQGIYAEGKYTQAYAQAEALFSQTLEIQRRALGPEHPDTLVSMYMLAITYRYEGKYAQAEVLYSQSLEIRRRVSGPENAWALANMNGLALSCYEQGKYAQAEALFSQELEISRRVRGPEDHETLVAVKNLARTYASQGKYAQAEALLSQTVEIERHLYPERPDTLWSINMLARTYASQGKYAQAEALFSQTLEIQRRVSPEHPDTLDTMADLVLTYQAQGKFASSEALAREAVEGDRKKRPDNWQRFRAESLLGASLAGQKKYAEAEPLLLEGYRGMLERKDRIDVPDQYHLDRAHEWLVHLYQSWGKPAKAAEWRKK
jgi:non-specific serine/threonine protein kinase/serine/threonine-protein kinase